MKNWKTLIEQWGGWHGQQGYIAVKNLAKHLDETHEPPKELPLPLDPYLLAKTELIFEIERGLPYEEARERRKEVINLIPIDHDVNDIDLTSIMLLWYGEEY